MHDKLDCNCAVKIYRREKRKEGPSSKQGGHRQSDISSHGRLSGPDSLNVGSLLTSHTQHMLMQGRALKSLSRGRGLISPRHSAWVTLPSCLKGRHIGRVLDGQDQQLQIGVGLSSIMQLPAHPPSAKNMAERRAQKRPTNESKRLFAEASAAVATRRFRGDGMCRESSIYYLGKATMHLEVAFYFGGSGWLRPWQGCKSHLKAFSCPPHMPPDHPQPWAATNSKQGVGAGKRRTSAPQEAWLAYKHSRRPQEKKRSPK